MGLLGTALLQKYDTEDLVFLGVVRLQPERVPQRQQRLVMAALLKQQNREIFECGRMVGGNLKRRAVARLCLTEPAGTMVRECDREVPLGPWLIVFRLAPFLSAALLAIEGQRRLPLLAVLGSRKISERVIAKRYAQPNFCPGACAAPLLGPATLGYRITENGGMGCTQQYDDAMTAIDNRFRR